MGQVRIYHNPKCSTSRKALQRIRDTGVEPEIVRYLDTPPTRAELAAMITAAGLTPAQAVRRREALFGELQLAGADDDALLDAMAEHPRLIERPFVVTDTGTRLARPVESIDEIL
ncbi:arsenate reductase (glutaredoxin) [Williamsia sp. CHRR-6]|uniref:arsenate reductase (glutaredoxin) n=1 Tax=Williamsia sp. CHRR-6 TaxID=2835871 RepID=UPI001BD9EE32|nr:arsenate reductase (glutaredoxin) [Williamsia sp. CHRR-6]MBT0566673.1 arsenate reductase (glutaredoxin) [Williamsia sp. CHRR-6]